MISISRIVDNHESLLNFLLSHRVIRNTIICSKCRSELNLNRETLLLRCSVYLMWWQRKKKTKSLLWFTKL